MSLINVGVNTLLPEDLCAVAPAFPRYPIHMLEITNGSLLAGAHPLDEAATHVLLKLHGHRVLRKRFAPGEGMAPHHAPNDVLVVVLAGKMIITVDSKPQNYVAGDYVIFPAGTEHGLQCVEAAQALIYL